MTEFKAGEYLMRNGQKAVVLGEMPETPLNEATLAGYANIDGENRLLNWRKDGKKWNDNSEHSLDLTPKMKKIEQWLYSFYKKGSSVGVVVADNEKEAVRTRLKGIDEGYVCSEIVKAPTLDVEE